MPSADRWVLVDARLLLIGLIVVERNSRKLLLPLAMATPFTASGWPLRPIHAATSRTVVVQNGYDDPCDRIDKHDHVCCALDECSGNAFPRQLTQLPLTNSRCPAPFARMQPNVRVRNNKIHSVKRDAALLRSAFRMVAQVIIRHGPHFRLLYQCARVARYWLVRRNTLVGLTGFV